MEAASVLIVTIIAVIVFVAVLVYITKGQGKIERECDELKQQLTVKTLECEELKQFKAESLTEYEVQKSRLEEQIAAGECKVESLQSYWCHLEKTAKNQENEAQEKYALKIANLEKEYSEKNQELGLRFQENKMAIDIEMEELLAELKKLRATKAATIEAFQREEAIKSQKDMYRIVLPENDEKDIAVLQSVECRLNNPRILRMLIWQTYIQPISKVKFPQILGSKKVTGIYKITNIKNEKCYVGQAIDVYKRLSEHCKAGLGIDTPQGNKLYAAMREDGISNFTFELLEECSEEELNEKERFYISVYNSVNYGYNSQQGNKKKV